ncbi:hypothetical protein [Aerolutibacter ruishenii]|uniref:Secreted protein n=1 Tax=Aerolutibacter ruishenii TaxID=686800 RepID=A0A562M2E6_9GAMM|nr:hypothetical protein [Lysobacter ruishenii]TWI14104.1 hypothetical protein IP93_00095 [Lysobacter ruishenii]
MPLMIAPLTRARILATALALGLALPLAASAQDAAGPPRIEQQMTPEQFRAAGLDRLTPEQLANLNAWLNRTLVVETQKAATQARKKVEDESRGFLSFGSSEPIVSRFNGEFRGFARGRRYVLANDQTWEQIDDASLAGVRLTDPEVRITPSVMGNVWYMQVGKYGTRAKVQRIK